MAILRLRDRYTGPVAIAATGLFLITALMYFLPIEIQSKIAIPVGIAALASFWVCPWEITMALLFSALGDLAGSYSNFLLQMGSFGIGHIWYIIFFTKRYFKKVEPDFKLTAKAKGYMAMVIFCVLMLLTIAFVRIVPCAPAGIIRTCTGIYACLICTMLLMALLQRSSLYALGAVLFVFSDFILAWNKFVEPVTYSRLLIMIPYYAAQWLLFIRSTPFRVAPEMRIMRF